MRTGVVAASGICLLGKLAYTLRDKNPHTQNKHHDHGA